MRFSRDFHIATSSLWTHYVEIQKLEQLLVKSHDNHISDPTEIISDFTEIIQSSRSIQMLRGGTIILE